MKTQTIIFGNKKDPSAMLRSLMFGRFRLDGLNRMKELSSFRCSLSTLPLANVNRYMHLCIADSLKFWGISTYLTSGNKSDGEVLSLIYGLCRRHLLNLKHHWESGRMGKIQFVVCFGLERRHLIKLSLVHAMQLIFWRTVTYSS